MEERDPAMADRDFTAAKRDQTTRNKDQSLPGGRRGSGSTQQQSPWKQLFYRARECQYTLSKDEKQVLDKCQNTTIKYYLEGALGGGVAAFVLSRGRELGQRLGFALMASYTGVVIASHYVERPCMAALFALEDSPLRGEMLAILQEGFPDHPMLQQELKRQKEGKGFVMYDEKGERTYPRLQPRGGGGDGDGDGVGGADVLESNTYRSGNRYIRTAPPLGGARPTWGAKPPDEFTRNEDDLSSRRAAGAHPWRTGRGGWDTERAADDAQSQSRRPPWSRAREVKSAEAAEAGRQEENERRGGAVDVGDGWREESESGTMDDNSSSRSQDVSITSSEIWRVRRQSGRDWRQESEQGKGRRGDGSNGKIGESSHVSDPFDFLYGSDKGGPAEGEGDGEARNKFFVTREERRKSYMEERRAGRRVARGGGERGTGGDFRTGDGDGEQSATEAEAEATAPYY